MRFIADLHIHSKYARAVSPRMVLEELDRWAGDKGIQVMGTGDFTYPAWIKEMEMKLEPAEQGLYTLKDEYKLPTISGKKAETRFLLSVEISCIYKRAGKVRKIHNLILVPDIETAQKINAQLSKRGNLLSDGRPIIGMDCRELADIVFSTNPRNVLIPAHAWTPWFGIFGSKSGFDSIEECFGPFTKDIFAIETGLSSDPAMNWRVSALDHIAFISNSDSHSPERIGREANVFDTDLSYDDIMEAIRRNKPDQFPMTIEFHPEEGMYHFDGHRDCKISFTPEESKKHNFICPVCKRVLTIGVMNRVEQLADRPDGYTDPKRIPFKNLIPLDEIVGEALEVGKTAKKVKAVFDTLIKSFGNELSILLDVNIKDIASIHPRVAEAVELVRNNKLQITPGFDGQYGKVSIFEKAQAPQKKNSKLTGKPDTVQSSLF